jgi:hypothetical protein
MKVKIIKRSKEVLRMSDTEAIKEVRDCVSEDKLSDYTQMIAQVASGKSDVFEILKADAEISRNCRVWNAYGNNSKDLDIWVEIYAYNSFAGFYEIGCYMTDIWNYYSDIADEIRSHMFILEFHRKKF